MRRRADVARRLATVAMAGALALAACGSDGSDGDEGVGLSGVVADPAPVVSGVALPSLTEPGAEVDFGADPGDVQVVYFGFTNCPDVCPTTLADLTVALRLLDAEEPGLSERVDTVMVTVDPERDIDVLPGYIQSFVPDAEALGTLDEDLLLAAAEPFGVTYDVRTLDDGTIEVDHSPFLYAIDANGELLLSWQFNAKKEDIAADLRILLERAEENVA